jgi:hypothetical protein
VKSYKAFKDACDKEDDGMASIVAMDGTCRKGWNLSEPQEGFIGMDLSEPQVEMHDEIPAWLEKLTCTPWGIASLVAMSILLSPILVVFGAFYGAFKPFGR